MSRRTRRSQPPEPPPYEVEIETSLAEFDQVRSLLAQLNAIVASQVKPPINQVLEGLDKTGGERWFEPIDPERSESTYINLIEEANENTNRLMQSLGRLLAYLDPSRVEGP